MGSFCKYSTIARLSWQPLLTYRFNFVIGRIRDFIVLLTLYYLYNNIFTGQQELFGFDREKIVSYIILSHLIFSFVFTYAMHGIADTIALGHLNNFLTKPLNFFGYWAARQVGVRIAALIFSVIDVVILMTIFQKPLLLPTRPGFLGLSLLALVFSVVIFSFLDFLIPLAAFKMHQAVGPRFVFSVFLELATGRFFPLTLLPGAVYLTFKYLPLNYIIFFPIQIYFGQLSSSEIIQGFTLSILWTIILWLTLKAVWNKALKSYQAYGG